LSPYIGLAMPPRKGKKSGKNKVEDEQKATDTVLKMEEPSKTKMLKEREDAKKENPLDDTSKVVEDKQDKTEMKNEKEAIATAKIEEKRSTEFTTNEGDKATKAEKDINVKIDAPKTDVKVVTTGESALSDKGILSDKYVAQAGTIVNEANKNAIPTSSQIKEIEQAVTNSYSTPYTGSPMRVSYKTFGRELRVKSEFPCFWTWESINLLNHRRQKFKYTIHIKPFKDRLEFFKNRMELTQTVIAAYEYIFKDVPQVENVFLGLSRVTDPNHAGLKLMPDYITDQSLFARDLEQFRAFYKYNVKTTDVYRPDGTENPLLKDHNAFIEFRERDLINKLQANLEKLILPDGINKKRKFFLNLTNKYRFMPPLNANMQMEWWYVIHDTYKFESPLRHLVDNNLIMREFVRKLGATIVQETIDVSLFTAEATMDTISRGLGLNQNIIAQVNMIPGSVSPQNGSQFMTNLFNVCLNRKWSEFYMPINFEEMPDITILLDCIGYKLFTPKWIWNPRTIVDIDNYIYINFFCRMPPLTRQNRFTVPDPVQLRNSSFNYLTDPGIS
jgi:hypothetical protein